MTAKERAHMRVLTETFVSKSTIQHVLGCKPDVATEAFKLVKSIELETAPVIQGKTIDVRKHRVPTSLFLKTFKLNRNLIERQYLLKNKIERND